MAVQHNPYSHSILCPATQETFDAFEARELEAPPDHCPQCVCSLGLLPDAPKAEAESVAAPAKPEPEPAAPTE